MATHSSIPVWRIPWTEETGGLQSMGLQRIGHNQATKQAFMQGPTEGCDEAKHIGMGQRTLNSERVQKVGRERMLSWRFRERTLPIFGVPATCQSSEMTLLW